jgi:hypothetical protein
MSVFFGSARFGGVTVDFPELAELRKELQRFKPNIAAKHLGSAIRKATKPGQDALKREVRANQKGPTGNLLRSVTTKVVTYKKTGNAVGMVGFTAAGSGKSQSAQGGKVRKGKDRAFHQGWLEFGTRPRRTKKGNIASSYRKLGPFTLKKTAKRGKFAGVVRVQTTPRYPKAFFKRASKNEDGVYLGRTLAEAPIKTAFTQSVGAMRTRLRDEMANAIYKASRDIADKFPPKARQ